MHDWCPECNAMLSPGTEKCPRCGKKIIAANDKSLGTEDIANITLTVLAFAAIPLIIIILISIICVLSG
jgi:uncharacterized paraquat-inducible protein A